MKDNVTLGEAKLLQANLDADIQLLVKEFTAKTGLDVVGVEVHTERIYVPNLPNLPRYKDVMTSLQTKVSF